MKVSCAIRALDKLAVRGRPPRVQPRPRLRHAWYVTDEFAEQRLDVLPVAHRLQHTPRCDCHLEATYLLDALPLPCRYM